jgi:hypothetical protein
MPPPRPQAGADPLLRAQAPSAILKELGSGKLFDKGSILWKSLPEEEDPAVRYQRDFLREIRELKIQLQQKDEKIRQAQLETSTAVANVREQYERVSEAASENHKRALARANEDRLNCQNQLDAVSKQLKAAEAANTRLSKTCRRHVATIEKLQNPVDSFADTLRRARRQRRDGESLPDDCNADQYTINTPTFVLNRLRSLHRPLWIAHVKQMMRILGWKIGRWQDKGFGGTVCAAFCLLGATDKELEHGCWDPASLLTALCHSNSGRSNLQHALIANTSLQRAHKAALQEGAQLAAFHVAAEALGSGATKRHRAAILKVLPWSGVTERKVAKEMRKLKTSVKKSTGIRPTGTDGAAALLFKSASMAFEIMPFRNNVVMQGIHSSCLFRAGILRIAAWLKADLPESEPPSSEYTIDLSAEGQGHLTHLSLGKRLRQKLLDQTGSTCMAAGLWPSSCSHPTLDEFTTWFCRRPNSGRHHNLQSLVVCYSKMRAGCHMGCRKNC